MSKSHILFNKTATKEQLRKHIAESEGLEYKPFRKLSAEEQFRDELKAIINDFYAGEPFNKKFIWNKTEHGKLKELIGQLDEIVTYKKQANATKEDIVAALRLIMERIATDPKLKWYRNEFSISLISRKFNEITAKIQFSAQSDSQNVVRSAMQMRYGK